MMKKLKLSHEEMMDLLWFLKEIIEGTSEDEYPRLFKVLGLVLQLKESYRVSFPNDPDLLAFIDSCRETQKEKEETIRKERIRELKAVNQKHVDVLKKYHQDFRARLSESVTLEFEPLSEGDLPGDIKEEHLTTLKQLLLN